MSACTRAKRAFASSMVTSQKVIITTGSLDWERTFE